MTTRTYEGVLMDAVAAKPVIDSLSVEKPLQICINSVPFTITMRTPGSDADLIRGLLHSEDVVNDLKFNPKMVELKSEEKRITDSVDLIIPEKYLGLGYTNSRSLLSVSSCGICGNTKMPELDCQVTLNQSGRPLSQGLIASLFEQMKLHQQDFEQSGGTHAAAAFDGKGNLLAVREDIGRHNAVDKVIGRLVLHNELSEAQVLTVSGRISYEIAIKAFKAGIPVLAAVSAPSSLAVDYAKELGITLIGFCRANRFTCYANPQRINHLSCISSQ